MLFLDDYGASEDYMGACLADNCPFTAGNRRKEHFRVVRSTEDIHWLIINY